MPLVPLALILLRNHQVGWGEEEHQRHYDLPLSTLYNYVPPFPAHYSHLDRNWVTGDLVELSLGLTYWIKSLPDTRPEYADLKALMMVSGGLRIMEG